MSGFTTTRLKYITLLNLESYDYDWSMYTKCLYCFSYKLLRIESKMASEGSCVKFTNVIEMSSV